MTTPEADEPFAVTASFSQRQLWMLEQLESDAARYNIQLGLRFLGELDPDALRGALADLVLRHETLRTTFAVEGDDLVQLIHPCVPLAVHSEDLVTDADPEAAFRLRARTDLGRTFDLAEGPLLRAALYTVAPGDSRLVVTVDHIVCDGWSLPILHDEITALYQARCDGAASPLPELAIQYADFAVWQRETLSGPHLDKELAWWSDRLAGPLPRLEMPTDRPRTAAAAREDEGGSSRVTLPDELVDALDAVARGERASLQAAMLTGFVALLYRYSGQADVVIGSLLANRTRSELEGMIGFFVNTVTLRVDVSGNPTFRELLRRVRETTWDVHSHQEVPFERVVEEINPPRDAGRQPLFDVMFQMADIDRRTVTAGDAVVEPLPMDSAPAPVDLAAAVIKEDGHYSALWDYDARLFEHATIVRMQEHFLRLLRHLAAAPDTPLSDAGMLSAAELRAVADWGTGAAPAAGDRRGPLELLEYYARTSPDAVALVSGDRTVTYGELDDRSTRLARRLTATGVRPQTAVGVLLERGVDMVLALVAVLKAGAVYLPLDPAYPAERLAYIVEDADPSALVTRTDLLDRAPERARRLTAVRVDEPAADESTVEDGSVPGDRWAAPDELAYLIYTSGSTGRPKGVAVPHRGLPNLIAAQRAAFGLTCADRVLQFASPNFDASVFELLLAVGAGAELHLLPVDGYGELSDFLVEHAITAAVLPPSALATLTADRLPELRTLTVAGEACPAKLARRWSAGRRFLNLYGPTEATIWSTGHLVADPDRVGASVPIGRPVHGVVVRVLDPWLNPVPAGVPGELHVGGDAVVRGYLNRPALSAERFIPDPFAECPGARLHRTGDMVRWTADGELHFLGRNDHQVKMRGFRVDLGEIEAALADAPGVDDIVVVLREDVPGVQQLVAYVVGADVAEERLRAHAARSLPEHMVPTAFVRLDRLPLGPNGKVDRTALPSPVPGDAGEEHELPTGPVEELVAQLWSELLGGIVVGRQGDFFQLGGHSLLATMVVTRLRQELDIDLPVRTLFDRPVLADFVDALLQAEDDRDDVHEVRKLSVR